MKTVTAFRINPRAPDKVVIELDGARLASLPADAVAQFDLSVGRLLTEDEYKKLSYISDVEAAHSRSLRMLTVRPRAVNDLLRRLRAKGHNPSAAAEAVGRLEASGLLDDEKFAEQFAHSRAHKGHGRSRLLADLLRQGVDGRVAAGAIDRVLDEEQLDQEGQVRDLVRKRLKQLDGLSVTVKRRRLIGFLSRRGFGGSEVWGVIEEILKESS